MLTHKLKTWPEYFQKVLTGDKTWEFRKDDREFNVGDRLVLMEYDPEEKRYTGNSIPKLVTYIACGGLIPAGFVVMSIKPWRSA